MWGYLANLASLVQLDLEAGLGLVDLLDLRENVEVEESPDTEVVKVCREIKEKQDEMEYLV